MPGKKRYRIKPTLKVGTEDIVLDDFYSDKPTVCFVRDCPYRYMEMPNPCEKVPINFVCGTAACWRLGQRLKEIDWHVLTDGQLTAFVRSLHKDEYEATERLIDAYLAEQNRPA